MGYVHFLKFIVLMAAIVFFSLICLGMLVKIKSSLIILRNLLFYHYLLFLPEEFVEIMCSSLAQVVQFTVVKVCFLKAIVINTSCSKQTLFSLQLFLVNSCCCFAWRFFFIDFKFKMHS